FVNRSAVKLANLDHLVGLLASNSGGGKWGFADLCAGPGGFTEYVLWRMDQWGRECVGLGITLRGEQDFVVEGFNAVSRDKSLRSFKAFYGGDGSGDICKLDNIRGFAEEALKLTQGRGMDLVMGDGGFFFGNDDLYQEHHIKRILVGQILAMFMTIAEGGSFLLKLFETQSPFTMGLLKLVSTKFRKFTMIKPYSSRPANSERYVIYKTFFSNTNPNPSKSSLINHLTNVMKELDKLVPGSSDGGNVVSSHTVAPPGFMSMEKRVNEGVLDVEGVVDDEVWKLDEEFVEYVKGVNVKLAMRQTEALLQMEKAAQSQGSGEVGGFDARDVARRCLEEWKLPV
ncbi:FtsJ methyltransferase domain-containing protein 2, partial [Blyttiomyces sp. JEL0837]